MKKSLTSSGSTPTTESVALRIRSLRQKRGWTLAHVESLSKGRLNAIVLGSYERGNRALSLKRMIEIAEIFGVPLSYLLESPEESHPASMNLSVVLDLRELKKLSEVAQSGSDQTLSTLRTFCTWIAGQRSDWNGEVMTLRTTDLTTLSLMASRKPEDLLEWLEQKNLLFKAKGRF